jgi:dTDP-glucose pyrophosphorylase
MHGVLTLAGEGTRMLPWSRGLRKEFLPLVDRGINGHRVLKPIAHLALEALVGAGATRVTLVTSPRDAVLARSYFAVDPTFLDRHAHHAERLTETAAFYSTLSRLKIDLVQQPTPKGFGDAVLRAEARVAGAPFLLHAGDAVVLEKERGSVLRQMADLREREGLDAVLLVRRVKDPARYGVIEGRADGRAGALPRLRVTGMEEKPAHPRSHWAATAAYALSSRIFEALRQERREAHPQELEVTAGLQRLIRDRDSVTALVLTPQVGEWRSVGSSEGFLHALRRSGEWAERNA